MTWYNRILNQSATNMDGIPDGSVALAITSPPYNVGKDYGGHDDNMTVEDWTKLVYDVSSETARKLCVGGRLAVNVANTGRQPYLSLVRSVHNVLEAVGLSARAEIIWQKAKAANGTAWGSWLSPANPFHRDMHEYIVVYQKGLGSRALQMDEDWNVTQPLACDITGPEFMEASGSVWYIPAAARKKDGHPTPFPEKLVERLIKFYTWPGEVVLDPFNGSGTTTAVAQRLGRRWVGFDISAKYCEDALLRTVLQ